MVRVRGTTSSLERTGLQPRTKSLAWGIAAFAVGMSAVYVFLSLSLVLCSCTESFLFQLVPTQFLLTWHQHVVPGLFSDVHPLSIRLLRQMVISLFVSLLYFYYDFSSLRFARWLKLPSSCYALT